MANFLLLSDDYRDLYDPKTGKIEGSKKLHKVVPQIFRAPVLKPYARKRLFEASVSFSIVRHPFERYETKIIISKVFKYLFTDWCPPSKTSWWISRTSSTPEL